MRHPRHLLLLPLAFAVSAWAQAPSSAAARAAAQRAPAASTVTSPSADELVESARQQLQAGNAQQALLRAQQARRTDPASYKPPYYIAYALMALGDFGGAAEAQAASLALAQTPDQQAAVQALGATIAAQGSVVEADKAAEEGLDAKAARLYKAAFEAGLQRPEIGLKAAKLLEQRLKDVAGAVVLLRAVQDRFPGSPSAATASAELSRLQPALAALAQQRLRAAHEKPRGSRQQLLQEVLAIDASNSDALFSMANEALTAADWPQVEAHLKALLQRRILDEGLRTGKVRLYNWQRDARLRELLEDAWGPEAAGKILGKAARSVLRFQTGASNEPPNVRTVAANGPAQKAGMAVGDVIVSVAGAPVATALDAWRETALLPAGMPMAIVVRRGATLHTLYATGENNTEQGGSCTVLGSIYKHYEGDCKDGIAEGMGKLSYTAVNDVEAIYVGGFKDGLRHGKGQTTLMKKTGPEVVEMLDGKQL